MAAPVDDTTGDTIFLFAVPKTERGFFAILISARFMSPAC